jgi:hypothetical protein
VLLGEVLTGLIIAALLTFFLLKDGARIWGYVLSLMGDHSRGDADELAGAPTPPWRATFTASRSSDWSTRSCSASRW